MGTYSDMLLGGATPVQDKEPATGSYSQQLLGTTPAARQEVTQEPQTEQGWGEWLVESVKGKRDPRFENAGTVFEQFPGELSYPTGRAAIAGASDPQMADIVRQQLGDRFVRREKDVNGYDVFVTRASDDSEQAGYVNAPGLDSQDISRGIYGAMPYVIGGMGIGAVTKGAPLIGRMLAQGAGAGATSLIGDAAQMPMGSEQGGEWGKAAVTGAVGSAGPFVGDAASALWRRFVTVPGLFNRGTGKLTDKGAEAARQAGLNPDEMEAKISKTFADTYAKTGKASEAAVKAREGEFGIPSTVGQRTKDPWQLTQEEAMRRSLHGEKARDTMRAFDKEQQEAIDFAARTRIPSDIRTATVRESGTMDPRGITDMRQLPPTADLGESIQGGMRSAREAAEAAEDAAWKNVTDILPKQDAFEFLPGALSGRLGGMRITPEIAPKATAMARALDDYVAGKAFAEPAAKVLQQTPVKTVDEMRRQLLGIYKSTVDKADAKAARAIYEGFDDWIDEAADRALLAGAPEAAANLRIARDTTKVMQSVFSPAVKGRKTPAGKLMQQMAEADSPERVVQILFGPASSVNPSTIKNGSVEALRNMKNALQTYADPRVAADTIADLKLAYWAKLVQNKQGAVQSPGNMLNNIKAALSNQGTLVRELFAPDEIALMQRLAKQLETIVYKPPNASGSGYTAAGLAKQFFGKVIDAIPFAREALEYTGASNAVNAVAARRAVAPTVKPEPQDFAPFINSAGATYSRERN